MFFFGDGHSGKFGEIFDEFAQGPGFFVDDFDGVVEEASVFGGIIAVIVKFSVELLHGEYDGSEWILISWASLRATSCHACMRSI